MMARCCAFVSLVLVPGIDSLRANTVRMSAASWTQKVAPGAGPGDRAWTKTPVVEPWWEAATDKPMQTAEFVPGLWGFTAFPLPDAAEPPEGDNHVRVSIYDIGGSMKKPLGVSACKEFPIIPHVGVRVFGREHFFSDHVEDRVSGVMNEMMPPSEFPQVTFDLGVTDVDEAAIEAWLRSADGKFCPENYDLWKCNCNHFAQDFATFLLPGTGIPQPIMDPVMDFTDSMLDNVPEWRRAAGQVFMNQLSRFVVVSWGRVVRGEKERTADKLGVARGA